jgi:hypothetical protein
LRDGEPIDDYVVEEHADQHLRHSARRRKPSNGPKITAIARWSHLSGV